MNARDVACVVLASGRSSRFGDIDKLQATLCGKPVLTHVLDTVSEVGFAKVFLVSRDVFLPDIITVKNDDPEKGQGHALRLGLAAAQSKGFENICVMLGDMPIVEAGHIKSLIEKLTDTESVISLSGTQRLPPAVFTKKATAKILASESIHGARSVFDVLDFLTLPIADVQSLDVDTPEDLARIKAVMKAKNK